MPVFAAAWMALCAAVKSIKISAAVLLYAACVACGATGAEAFEHAFRLRIAFVTLEGLGPKLADFRAAEAASVKAAQARAAAVTAAQIAATAAAGAADAAAQAKISAAYRTLSQEVTTYVPPKADADCTVDTGALRLLDAAASGLPAVPFAPGPADDAPSGLALSALVATDVENDEAAAANAEQLSALQAWVRAQQSAWITPSAPSTAAADGR